LNVFRERRNIKAVSSRRLTWGGSFASATRSTMI
jgi:hypothetical protein